MQIVIDIDENVFTRLFDNGMEDYEIATDDLSAIATSIRKGILLPKGHGDLIDRNLTLSDVGLCEYPFSYVDLSRDDGFFTDCALGNSNGCPVEAKEKEE